MIGTGIYHGWKALDDVCVLVGCIYKPPFVVVWPAGGCVGHSEHIGFTSDTDLQYDHSF